MKKPKNIYEVVMDGEDSTVKTLVEGDTDYEGAKIDDFTYFSSRRSAVAQVKALLRNRIHGLQQAIKNLK